MLQTFFSLTDVSNSLYTLVRFIKGLIDEGKVKAIKSSKNYLISKFEYLKLIEAMEVSRDER